MPFQKTVDAPALGLVGSPYGGNPRSYFLPTPLASAAVKVGGFVWADAATGKVKATGTGKPLGVAVRERDIPLPCDAEATLTIPAGLRVPVLVSGDVILASTTAVTVGQAVFAVLADGTIKTDAVGGTVGSAIETDFIARTAAAKGEPFIASTVNPLPVTTPGKA